MNIKPLEASDFFIKILDYDQKISGLAGNIAQLIIKVDDIPKQEEVFKLIKQWINNEPALKIILKRKIFKDYWCILNKTLTPHISWHSDNSLEKILNLRLKDLSSLYNCPLLALDFIENKKELTILLTWHHILADAKGGELIFSRLRGNNIRNTYNHSNNQQFSFINNLKKLRYFRNVVIKRMSEGNIVSPVNKVNYKHLSLNSSYIQLSEKLSKNIKTYVKHINPIFGETALFIAISLKEIRKIIDSNVGNFLIPLPINLRNPTSIFPLLGNPLTFIFLLVERKYIEELSLLKLTKVISQKLIDDVKSDTITATNSALKIGKFIPVKLYRYILRSAMDGQLGSMFFANTGPSYIGDTPGKATHFLNHKVTACFHRPMVSVPPGIGFFYSTYDYKIHITICWIKEVIPKHYIDNISSNLIKRLENLI